MTLDQAIAEAIHEHDIHTVLFYRSLRVLNPWAMLANAIGYRLDKAA
jgi:hypothetical protein